jgi:hypothetical protein
MEFMSSLTQEEQHQLRAFLEKMERAGPAGVEDDEQVAITIISRERSVNVRSWRTRIVLAVRL